ncbi:ABC transporter substrate-binding protein [Ructibacterium gallinarum]|uniref:ABC transporter substrate-binding protein n=1 Tax=Ructibacterium gallinarum TaxID=2779355 RepID=A0A9D5R7N6_9FIRM|nr:ABC transporter substrate-binding protein [Ructibacterium gallinarum]MBE5038995.1 ABC transporter substrate-binding protein [Ructibacterium gallinarum]
MKTWKRTLAVMMGAAMALGGLVGCGGKTEESANAGVPTLTWYLAQENQSDKQTVVDEVNKILEKNVGARLDLQFIDAGSYNDKMTMMLASGKEVDLCFTADWTNKYIQNAQKGAFLQLDDMLETEAPKLKESIPDYLYDAVKVDGKLYAIPNIQVLFNQLGLIVFKDYADKYQFDFSTVKKVQDIEPYLKILKDKEPGLIPYCVEWTASMFSSPVYEEVIPQTGVVIRKDSTDYKAEILVETPEYKEGVKTLGDWYQKGYIREDVNSVLENETDLKAGKYGVYQARIKPGAESEIKLKYGKDSIIIPIEEPYLIANAGITTMTAIGRTSKYPTQALQIIQEVNTNKELYNMLCFGLEGKHYTWVDEDHIRLTPDSGYQPNVAWMFGNQFNAFCMEGQDADVWEQTKKMNDEAKVSPLAGFILDTEPIKTELSQIATVSKEYKAVSNGSDASEATYNEMLKKLYDAGQEKVLQEVQRQIDEWVKNKK